MPRSFLSVPPTSSPSQWFLCFHDFQRQKSTGLSYTTTASCLHLFQTLTAAPCLPTDKITPQAPSLRNPQNSPTCALSCQAISLLVDEFNPELRCLFFKPTSFWAFLSPVMLKIFFFYSLFLHLRMLLPGCFLQSVQSISTATSNTWLISPWHVVSPTEMYCI